MQRTFATPGHDLPELATLIAHPAHPALEADLTTTHAYLSESDDTDLTSGAVAGSGLLVLCTLLVSATHVTAIREQAEHLCRHPAPVADLTPGRRRAAQASQHADLLAEIARWPVRLHLTVVDRARIPRDGGLHLTTSFTAHIGELLHARLFRDLREVQLNVDARTDTALRERLHALIQGRYADDLFGDEQMFQVQSVEDDALLEVTRRLANAVRQVHGGKAKPAARHAFETLLQARTLGLLSWPPAFTSLLPPPMDEAQYADYQVHQEALRQADRFIEQAGEHPDEDMRLQLAILDYLRFQSEFVTQDYLPTADILAHLHDRGFGDVSEHKIRSNGIAKLRDANVIITSTAKGYKIPQTRADLNDFLEMASGVVVPLLERVRKAREVYRQSSGGTYDIVSEARLTALERLLLASDTTSAD